MKQGVPSCNKELLEAVGKEDIGTVKELLESPGRVDVNTRNQQGETPLHLAVQKLNYDIIELLLKHGANVNIKAHYGATPLGCNGAKDFREKFKELQTKVEKDLKAEEKQRELNKQLCKAAIVDKDIIAVRKLLEEGANPNIDHHSYGNPFFNDSIFFCNDEIVLALLEHIEDINRKDSVGNTALHRAASQGRLSIVKALLDAGADINAKNCKDRTPADMAAMGTRHEKVIDYLVSKGGKIQPHLVPQQKGKEEKVEPAPGLFKRFTNFIKNHKFFSVCIALCVTAIGVIIGCCFSKNTSANTTINNSVISGMMDTLNQSTGKAPNIG